MDRHILLRLARDAHSLTSLWVVTQTDHETTSDYSVSLDVFLFVLPSCLLVLSAFVVLRYCHPYSKIIGLTLSLPCNPFFLNDNYCLSVPLPRLVVGVVHYLSVCFTVELSPEVRTLLGKDLFSNCSLSKANRHTGDTCWELVFCYRFPVKREVWTVEQIRCVIVYMYMYV